AQVLAGVAQDAEPVGGRVEVHRERRRRRIERHGELVHERRLSARRVDRVDAAAVADAVELAVLDAEVDADERAVRARETRDGPDDLRLVGRVRRKAQQPPVGGEADGLQALDPCAAAVPRVAHAVARSERLRAAEQQRDRAGDGGALDGGPGSSVDHSRASPLPDRGRAPVVGTRPYATSGGRGWTWRAGITM